MNFAKKETNLIQAGVLWGLANAGTYIVGRTHLVTNTEWSMLESEAAPVVTGVVIFGVAAVWRRWLVPVWKTLQHDVPALPALPVPADPANYVPPLAVDVLAQMQSTHPMSG